MCWAEKELGGTISPRARDADGALCVYLHLRDPAGSAHMGPYLHSRRASRRRTHRHDTLPRQREVAAGLASDAHGLPHGAASPGVSRPFLTPTPGSPRHRVGLRVDGHSAGADAGRLGGRGVPVVLDALGLGVRG